MDIRLRICYLLDRYTIDKCTGQELAELFSYLHSGRYDAVFERHIEQNLNSCNAPGADLAASRSAAIVRKVFSASEVDEVIVRKLAFHRIKYWTVAAAVIAVMGIALFFLINSPGKPGPTIAKDLHQVNKRFLNTTDKAVQIQLEDGSRVTLQPSAALSYPKKFAGRQREVLLEGDAFFDIARNPQKPFLVYHGNLITRVLGTSFYIHHNNGQHESEVEVTHGKVEVYENAAFKKTQGNKGVVLTANQKAIYTESNHLLAVSLVDNPVRILKQEAIEEEGTAAPGLFDFEQASLSSISGILKENYGIEIELGNEQLSNCLFSGDVSHENLYGKLDIICRAIGGSYEIKGTKILIKGKGCSPPQ
jgi:transmembrane sensor